MRTKSRGLGGTSVAVIGAWLAAAALPAEPIEADFNGDGYADVVVGVPFEEVSGEMHAGTIHVLYGSANGISATGDEFRHRNHGGVAGAAEPSEHFGHSLAAGDFDGDGYSDLAVGVPDDNLGVEGWQGEGRGSVHVFYGSSSGLSSDEDQIWHQDKAGVKGQAHWEGRFGWSLTTGDFDADGYADLAIGAPGYSWSAEVAFPGGVNVLYGSAGGLTASGDQLWHQDSPGVIGAATWSDSLGWAVAAGDFDCDGYSDLAIGVWCETVSGQECAGAVNVLYGSGSGLSAADDEFWHQDVAGIAEVAEAQENFGSALAVGDFDGDGCDDLAIGVPDESISGHENAGAVHVLYGLAGWGLTTGGSQFWHQDRSGVQSAAQSGEHFGYALAAGDFDGWGVDDLAIGVPDQTAGGMTSAGAVHVLYGYTSGGLSEYWTQYWNQNQAQVAGMAEEHDWFGWSLAAGDFNGDGASDLCVGVPGESVSGNVGFAGAVHVFNGSFVAGLTSDGDRLWHKDSDGIADVAAEGDKFGAAVASAGR